MSLYSYIASGGLNIEKCGRWYDFQPAYFRITAFSVGDQAWIKWKAQIGVLESVVIKKIRIFPYLYLGRGGSTIIYVDTFNAIYNEWDLLSYADALTIATNYINQKLASASQADCLK